MNLHAVRAKEEKERERKNAAQRIRRVIRQFQTFKGVTRRYYKPHAVHESDYKSCSRYQFRHLRPLLIL